MKATITKKVVLAYLDFSKVFEIYTDASSKQLRAVITQDNRPIAFFSWKFSPAQHKYSVTKIELLTIKLIYPDRQRFGVIRLAVGDGARHKKAYSNHKKVLHSSYVDLLLNTYVEARRHTLARA